MAWNCINIKVVLHDAVQVATVSPVKQQKFFDLSINPQPPLVLQEELFLRVEGLQCLRVDNILHRSQRIAFVFDGFRRNGRFV